MSSVVMRLFSAWKLSKSRWRQAAFNTFLTLSTKKAVVSNDPAKQAAYLEGQRTNRKAKLEAQHKRFLDADYQPNKDWWGSSPAK